MYEAVWKHGINWTKLAQLSPTETATLINWAYQQQLGVEYFGNFSTQRLARWWGKGVKLLSYGKSWETFNAPAIADEPFLVELRDRFYKGANSVLLYRYDKGVGITEHTDKPVFEPDVVIINLIDTQPDLFGNKPAIRFSYNKEKKWLADGDVIAFNARLPHAVPPVKYPRFSISLRII